MPRVAFARQWAIAEIVVATDGSGNASYVAGEPPLGYTWVIERVLLHGSTTGVAEVRVGGNLRDIGAFDPTTRAAVADNPSPIYVPQQEQLRIRVRNADPNVVLDGYVQYRVISEAP